MDGMVNGDLRKKRKIGRNICTKAIAIHCFVHPPLLKYRDRFDISNNSTKEC